MKKTIELLHKMLEKKDNIVKYTIELQDCCDYLRQKEILQKIRKNEQEYNFLFEKLQELNLQDEDEEEQRILTEIDKKEKIIEQYKNKGLNLFIDKIRKMFGI